MYVKSERKYQKHREYIRHLIRTGVAVPGRDCEATTSPDTIEAPECNATSQIGVSNFSGYFERNSDNCVNQWCSFGRQSVVVLDNNTNNQLEASWKQLKEVNDCFITVDECIAFIMFYQTLNEKDYESRLYKLAVVRNSTYDSEISVVAQLVSEHAGALIYQEYSFAVTAARY